MTNSVLPDVVLDTRSLICPLPVLKTKKAIDSMLPGQVLEVSAKDGMAKSDIIQLVQRLKLQLLDLSEEDDNTRIMIKK